MIKTIVVASDGSDHAHKAVALAGEIAAKFDASLTVVHTYMRGPLPAEIRRLAEVEHLVETTPSPPTMIAIGWASRRKLRKK